jgi:hypothetical protein
MIGDLTQWASAALSRAAALLTPCGVRVALTPPAHPRASHVLDTDGGRIVGHFIVWPDGATEATILDVATEQPVYFDSAPATDLVELDARFRTFLDACVAAEKPSP